MQYVWGSSVQSSFVSTIFYEFINGVVTQDAMSGHKFLECEGDVCCDNFWIIACLFRIIVEQFV